MRRYDWITVITCLYIISPCRSQYRFTLPPITQKQDPVGSHQTDENSLSKGIFHYSDTDNKMQSKFKLPDLEEVDPMKLVSDLMSAAATAETKRKTLSGINLPMPFGTKPLQLQMAGETSSGLSLSESGNTKEKKDGKMPREAKTAFDNAKKICLQSSADSCDEALDTYHRVRYGSSLLSQSPSTSWLIVPDIHQSLHKLEKEDASEVNEDENERRRAPIRKKEREEEEVPKQILLPSRRSPAILHLPSRNIQHNSITEFLRRIS